MNISRKLKLYLFFAFFFSWPMALLYWYIVESPSPYSISFLILAIAFMFTPLASVIVVQKLFFKGSLKKPFGINFRWNRWWFVAWLLPLGIALGTFGISLLMPGVEFSPEMEGMLKRFEGVLTPEQIDEMRESLPVHPVFLTVFQGLIAGITINAVAGFGEELGWRGLMLKELAHLGFWKTSLTIGIIWGIWHAPIILMGHNYPEHPVAGVFMMIGLTILLSPLFTLLVIKTQSVIAASLFHGSFNALSGISIMLIKGGNDLLIGVSGVSGFIVLLILNLLFWATFNSDIKKMNIYEDEGLPLVG